MILIISNPDDRTTNNVIDWLLFYQQPFIRISSNNLIEYTNVTIGNSINNITFCIEGKSYKFSNFKAIWYRRGWVVSKSYNFDSENNEINKEINKQLYTEISTLNNYFISTLEKLSINSPNDLYLSKLDALEKASRIGIKIPNTLITSKKEDLLNFKKQYLNIITKNYSQGVFINYNQSNLYSLTTIVTDRMIKSLPPNFFPMMFQEMIPKEFELRIFFIEDEFYSSAIFSQNDEKTKIDFRNYNNSKPNRTPPFALPNFIRKKLQFLMSDLNLNSGSIDIIVDKNGDYVFLEVNPIGQFAQVSSPCNYYLERKMAEMLINKANEHTKENI